MVINRIGVENNAWIDGVLKAMFCEASLYAHRSIEPYLKSDPMALKDPDAFAFIEAVRRAHLKIGWWNSEKKDVAMNVAIERMAEVIAVGMEADNAYRVLVREICFEFSKLRGAPEGLLPPIEHKENEEYATEKDVSLL